MSIADILLVYAEVFLREIEEGIVDKTKSCWNSVSFLLRRLHKFFAQSSKKALLRVNERHADLFTAGDKGACAKMM